MSLCLGIPSQTSSNGHHPLSINVLLLDHQLELQIAYPLGLADRDVLVVGLALDADRYVLAYLAQANQYERAHVVLLIQIRIAFGRKSLVRPILDSSETVLVKLRL